MNSFFRALRNTTACNLLSRFNVLKSPALALLTIGAISSAAIAADLPGTVFVEPPEGMIEDSEGRFFAKLSALAMHRSDNPNVLLVSSNLGTPTTASEIRGGQLDNGWAAGGELILGINDIFENGDNGNWNIWGRGQLIGQWSDSQTAQITPQNNTTLGNATIHYLNVLSTQGFRAEEIAASYESIIWSLDLNLEKELNTQTTVFGGLRYFHIDEKLTLDAGSGDTQLCNFLAQCGAVPASGQLGIVNRANNQIYGLQLGISHELYVDDSNRLKIEGQALAGMALNFMETSASGGFANSNPINPFTSVVASADAMEFSMFAEGNLAARYEVTDSISLDLGYRALWIQKTAGVVRAIPNLDPAPAFNTDEASRIETDDMLLHGGRLGLKIRF